MLGRLKFDLSELANEMLDQLPAAVFESKTTTFLDPCMGGGQFVRAVEQRLRDYGHTDANIAGRVFGVETGQLRVNYAVNKHKLVGRYFVCENYLEYDEKMKFDVVIGNPPYQDSKSKGKSAELYQKFVRKSLKLSDRVLFITPVTWATNPSSSLKKELKDGLVYVRDTSDMFGIGIPTCVFHYDANHSGSCTVVNAEKEVFKLEEIGDTIPLRGNSISLGIAEKFKASETLGSLWGKTPIYRNDPRIGKGKIKIIETCGDVDKDPVSVNCSIPKEELPGVDWWKVCVNYVTNRKSIGTSIKIIPPGIATTYSIIYLKACNKKQAVNIKYYLSSKIVRFLVGTVKTSPSNSKYLFEKIPTVDFSHNWTDEELYKHFGLTQEEINYIEETVK